MEGATLRKLLEDSGVHVYGDDGYDITEETALEHLFCGNTPHLVINLHNDRTIPYIKAELAARIFCQRWGAIYTTTTRGML